MPPMNENPCINRWLCDKAMDRIDHALGRPLYPLRETYRNRYATSGPDVEMFEGSLHWEKIGRTGRMVFYGVTAAGRQALADHLATLDEQWRCFEITFDGLTSFIPAKTAGKAKYSLWLSISDCFADLTFGEFCRAATCRKVRA